MIPVFYGTFIFSTQTAQTTPHRTSARAAGSKEKRTDCSRSARSNTKPAARTAIEQRIENTSFTESFNVSMAIISLSTKNFKWLSLIACPAEVSDSDLTVP